MKRVNYKLTKEPYEEMNEAGRFNPCLEITFRDKKGMHKHKISAGYSDEIYVFRECDETYVLIQNTKLGYVGLEVFEGDDKVGDIFLQGEETGEVLGDDILSGYAIVKLLKEHIQD
jgi:hypothetical protein